MVEPTNRRFGSTVWQSIDTLQTVHVGKSSDGRTASLISGKLKTGVESLDLVFA